MKRIFFLLMLVMLAGAFGCSHFAKSDLELSADERLFEQRKLLTQHRSEQLFGVFEQTLSTEEEELLKFLYANMPLCDLADYDGEYFLKQVRYALKARGTFSWGSQISDDLFKHFVLPYRVNNENLDEARSVFYEQLKDRVKDMTLREAALEINHYCHEYVNYQSTDIRTGSPLATVRTSYGRCGEESTFTVAALRAVCIPARQVYTPRWAHCDDNHAWVEVWVDGDWYYLGACEPEPKLNMAWFTEPARRAMLVHTKVLGDYEGAEPVLAKTENYTELNVLDNYAITKILTVKVLDRNGAPAENAKVDFGLLNYAEFYPIASILTNAQGVAEFKTGYGDLLVWASKNDNYALKKIAADETGNVQLTLNKHQSGQYTANYDHHPPADLSPYPIDEKLQAANQLRFAEEDRMREAYQATFIEAPAAYALAEKYGYDREKTWKHLEASKGNWREIKHALEMVSPEYRALLPRLLDEISEKDLRDTRADILLDHLYHTLVNFQPGNYFNEDVFFKYVLNPRVKTENLLAYRKYFHQAFSRFQDLPHKFLVGEIANWINEQITLNEVDNYYDLPISPVGVYQLRVANAESRDLFFVAACRSMGVPARLEQASKLPQYFDGQSWVNVYLHRRSPLQPDKGFLVLQPGRLSGISEPQYYIHFTFAKLETGVYRTADFGLGTKLGELPERIELEVGDYRMITANRRETDGASFCRLIHFTIEKAKTTQLPFELRKIEN